MYTDYSIGYKEITANDLRTDKTPIVEQILEEDIERLRLLFDDGIEYIFENKGRRILERKLTQEEFDHEMDSRRKIDYYNDLFKFRRKK